MRYIDNLRSDEAKKLDDPQSKSKGYAIPQFENKAEFRDWCAEFNTKHAFISYCEGDSPRKRVSSKNPVNKVSGFIADFDAPVDWVSVKDIINAALPVAPTWIAKTFSGYIRMIWEFEEPLPIDPNMYDAFIRELARSLKAPKAMAGFDECSYKASQYYEIGSDWTKMGSVVPGDFVYTALVKVAGTRPPTSSDTTVPMDIVAAEIEAQYPGRWHGEIEVGARGPLFWIEDGINRDGCQIAEDGVICYSDRAGKGFVSWREILGKTFIEQYERKKIGTVLDEYWFNGKSFFKLLKGSSVTIPKDQLLLELKAANFSSKPKKNQVLTEIEQAVLAISNHNRVDEIAPVVFSSERIVEHNGHRILNSASIEPIEPADDGDPALWPFMNVWLSQMFIPAYGITGPRPATDYLFAWIKRFYLAVLNRKFSQGQALLLVGPTNKGKSLLSNKVISAMVGGLADASEYLSGQTKFNKDLARVAAWVIDDTVSAASFQDQRRATELIKRAVANPRIEYHAKYVDAVSIPWTGRVILSLNMDANSLSVIPALDSSNRDKLLALRISDAATSNFPSNNILEDIIDKELPHFCKYILDWVVPQDIEVYSRFGIESYIDESIASAAYDNSSRSSIAELVEFFAIHCRAANPTMVEWTGTVTQFQVLVQEYNNGRHVGQSANLEFVRRGVAAMEEAYKSNTKLRPVVSIGSGGGKVWTIGIEERFDIIQNLH
jgi:hypothetical protein